LDNQPRTAFAQQAFSFTDMFHHKFGRLNYGSAPLRRIKLKPPEGMSTAGGRQARQPLTLTADDGSPSILFGWLDAVQKQAEFRSYSLISRQFEARYQRALDLRLSDYERLLEGISTFLDSQNFEYKSINEGVIPSRPKAKIELKPLEKLLTDLKENVPPIKLLILSLGVGLGFFLAYLIFSP